MSEVKFSEFQWKLSDLIRAGFSFVLVETAEEERVVDDIMGVVTHLNAEVNSEEDPDYRYAVWNCVTGLQAQSIKDDKLMTTGFERSADISDLMRVLEKEFHFGKANAKRPAVIVLKDAHAHFKSPTVIRMFRNLSPVMKTGQQMIVLVSPRFEVPVEMEKEVHRLDYPLPGKAMLAEIFHRVAPNTGMLDDPYVEAVTEAAAGSISVSAENIFAAAAISTHRQLGKGWVYGKEYVSNVFTGKIANLKNSFLEYVPVRGDFSSVGGLTPVKEWARERRKGFDAPARRLYLPYPKGALIAGIRGCGKTTVAQAIAGEWGFPFYKLDMGKIFGSLVGQTEANTRALIQILDGLGRAVILLDEMDKFFNQSAVSGAGDTGTSSRLFGTFLSWLSAKTCPIFIVGTMNKIDVLPPELTRKGRFDEIFFVDLPGANERIAIFNSLLEYKFKSAARVTAKSGAKGLAGLTEGFSGAEIESLIEDSLYSILANDPETEVVSEERLLSVMAVRATDTTPQSASDSEYVTKLREKTKSGFRRANDVETGQTAAGNSRRALNLN